MLRKYGKKATEKIASTLHEFKRGKLRSGSGRKVTSRQQALAIGLSQARRAGYKMPSQQGHAAMRPDTRVRVYLSNMQPGTKVDARGLARALGGMDPLEADYALERAQKEGLASTSDGKWFGPASQQTGHARMREQPAPSEIKLKDRYSGGHVWLTVRGDRVVGVMGADPERYMGMTLDEAKHHARHGGRVHHAVKKTEAQLKREVAEVLARVPSSYRLLYLAAGKRSMASEEFSSVADATRAVNFFKARGFTAWVEDDTGKFVPIKGTRRKPSVV